MEVPPIGVRPSDNDSDSEDSSENSADETVDMINADLDDTQSGDATELAHSESPVPPATPRPFPLPPPALSQELDESVLVPPVSDAADSESDDLPSVEKLVADTRPAYATPTKSQRVRDRARSTATLDDVPDRAIKMDVDCETLASTGIKRQSPDNHPMPLLPPRRAYTEITTDGHTYLEIPSSDSDGQPRSTNRLTTPATNGSISIPRPTPKKKSKRKRSHLSFHSTATAVTSNAALSTSPPFFKAPPSKRARTDDPAGRPHIHPRHWELGHGNNTLIQIQIGQVLFRRQRSLLSLHSDWFRHTFEQGDQAPELHDDGVLYLDKLKIDARDFTAILDAVDKAITFVHNPPPFRTMASILRVASTLSFTLFEDWGIKELQMMWSPRLKDLSTYRIPHAIESLALARLCGLKHIEKRIMYELVRSPGYGQNDEAGEDASDKEGDADDEGVFGGAVVALRRKKHVKLENGDKDALTHAREQLMSLWIMTAMSVSKDFMHCPVALAANADADSATAEPDPGTAPKTKDPPVPCTTLTLDLRVAHMRLVHESGLMEEYTFDALCGIQALMDAPWAKAGFCDGCVEMRRKAWQNAKKKAWQNLGIWFSLGHEEGHEGEDDE